MATLPWTATAPIDPDANYLVIATRFAVLRRRDLPGVVAATTGLWSRFGDTDGLIGYSLSARPVRGTLATLSAWRDHDTMLAFVRGPAHGEVVDHTRARLRESTFTSWRATGAELPADWRTADHRLELATRQQPGQTREGIARGPARVARGRYRVPSPRARGSAGHRWRRRGAKALIPSRPSGPRPSVTANRWP